MSEERELLEQINERVARTESRLVQLGDHVGANLRLKQRIDMHNERGEVWVEIDALDVPLSRIYAELSQAGVKDRVVPVRLGGRHIATVYPK